MKKTVFFLFLMIACLSAISKTDKDSIADVAFQKIKQGHNQEAFDYLNDKIRECKDCVQLYTLRSIARYNLGDLKGALKDSKKALKVDPGNAEAYYNKGVIFSDLDKNEKAVEEFNQAIRLKPGDHYYLISRGIAYSKLKQYDKALADLDQAIKLKPDTVKGYFTRTFDFKNIYLIKANIYFNMTQYEEALKECDEALKKDPAFNEAYGLKGVIYYKMGDMDNACESFKKSREFGNTSVSIQNMIDHVCN